MTAAVWDIGYGLSVYGAVLLGYAWLTVLTWRVRHLHRRLAIHTCRDTAQFDPAAVDSAAEPIPVAVLLHRHEDEQRLAPPARHRPQPVDPDAAQTDQLRWLPAAGSLPRPPGGSGTPRSRTRPAPPIRDPRTR